MRDRGLYSIDWDLIQKYVNNTISEEEKIILHAWMQEDDRRKSFVERVVRYYKKGPIEVNEARVDTAWMRFVRQQKIKARRMYRLWLSGVASVLLCVSVWVLWSVNQYAQKDEELIENYIHPGSKKAILSLSNGERVVLDDRENDRVVIDNQMRITLDSASVRYGSQAVSGEMLYNTIEVPRGGEYQLTLSDGTKVWLNAQSSLRFPLAFNGKERKVYLVGEAYFDVVPGHKRFVVSADGVDVNVLGTAFNVDAYEDEDVVRTTLIRGKVEVLTKGKFSCQLVPGEQSIWEKSNDTVRVVKVNTSLYTQWKDGYFVFRDQTLKNIMKILSRWYDVDYEFTRQELEKERFYGVIKRFESIKGLLNQFEKTRKVKFDYEKNKIIIK